MPPSLHNISGNEKAAIFLLSIPEETTAQIMGYLEEAEIRDISQTMSSLGKVDANVVQKLIDLFVESITNTGSLTGGYDTAQRLLKKTLRSDQYESVVAELKGPAGRTMWDKLSNVNESVLANYLKNEYPQTVAVIMSKITVEHAAKVLSVLPEDFAMDVITRMISIDDIHKEILNDIETTLRQEFIINLHDSDKKDSYAVMAEIFNNMPREKETSFLERLEERNTDIASKVQSLMFTFQDLEKLDANGIQTLIKSIDNKKLALSLKGASDKMRDLVFSNMSERGAKLLKDAVESLGPVRLKDIDEAQQAIVKVAKELMESGDIISTGGGDSDQIVY